jgi:death on curing protein
LPRNNQQAHRISAALIENAHDFGIAMVWPGSEPVHRSSCLDLNLLQSAAHQPYQECFGQELYPTVAAKAAYLFIHLASGHVFSNGNKRTAALCLDAFALVNSYYLALSNDEIHKLSKSAASYRVEGKTFHQILESTTRLLEENLVPVKALRQVDMIMYRAIQRRKLRLRKHRLNQLNTPLSQRQ